MDKRIALIPFAQKIVAKAAASAGQPLDVEKLKNQIDDVILSKDQETLEVIDQLIEDLRPEPAWAVGARTMIRPLMTLILTITFVTLILGQVGVIGEIPTGEEQRIYKEVFTVFLAIYGPIIGFWFGERTAERAPRK
jgi:hypothetical protein